MSPCGVFNGSEPPKIPTISRFPDGTFVTPATVGAADVRRQTTVGTAFPASSMPRRVSSLSRKNRPSAKKTMRERIAGR
jgi:hypothetical protein